MSESTSSSLYQPAFPSQWANQASLHSLAMWVNGMAFRNIDFTPAGRPVIKIAELKNGITGQTKFTSREYDDKYLIRSGDLLYSWSGQPESSLDAFRWDGPEGWLNQHIFKVVPACPEVDAGFLFYLIKALKPTLVSIARNKQTTGLGHVTKADLQALQVRYPEVSEQRAIAGVLGALDELIGTNESIRASVEQKGEALVRLLAGVGLGLIAGEPAPQGWALSSMGEVSSVIESGRRPKGGVKEIAWGIPSIGAESISGLGLFDFGKTKYVPPEFAGAMRRGVLESRDVLVYKDGGKPGDFRPHVGMFGDGFPYEHMVINEHVYRVRAAPPLTEPYLYFWLRQPALMDWMKMLGTGAAIPGINSTAFKSVPVAVPPHPVREMLFPVLDALVGEGLAAAKEARLLAQTRDELLPLLMSGAVSPREVAAG